MKAAILMSRRLARKTQQEMADMLFVSLRHYQRIEGGHQPLRPAQVAQIVEVSGNNALADTYCRNCPVRRLTLVVDNEK